MQIDVAEPKRYTVNWINIVELDAQLRHCAGYVELGGVTVLKFIVEMIFIRLKIISQIENLI